MKLIRPIFLKAPTTRIHSLLSKEKAYLAGLIDGEGSIGIYKTNCKTFFPKICVAMSHREVIVWCAGVFGCSLCISERRKERVHHKVIFSTVTSSTRNVHAVLSGILPFLQVKKEHASIVMSFCSRKIKRVEKSEKRCVILDKSDYSRLRALNRCGRDEV